MRRSRLDMSLGRDLRIDQRWRRDSDGTIWRVHQVHRVDCLAEVERAGARLYVSFRALRCDWERVPVAEHSGQLALALGGGA